MKAQHPVSNGGTRLLLPQTDLLDTARARLQRQKQYARVLTSGGNRAEGLRLWIEQAADCITTLARPKAFTTPVTARSEYNGVCLADRVRLEGADLASAVARGGQVTAYLLTLNYSQSHAFEWLGQDYSAHHVQSDLGSEVLFALGREVHQSMRALTPTGRMRRIPVLANELCGQRHIWEPASVQALLTVFDDVNPGVCVTDTGCFQPLNSLLGLTLHFPDD